MKLRLLQRQRRRRFFFPVFVFFFFIRDFFFSFFIFSQRDEQGVRNGGVGRARMFVFTKRRAS